LQIESHEFGTRSLCGELPINANLLNIASPRPGSCLTTEYFQIWGAPVQASLDEYAQFDSGDIQPTAMLGGVMNLQPIKQLLCFGGQQGDGVDVHTGPKSTPIATRLT